MRSQTLNWAAALLVIVGGVAMVARLRRLSLSHQPSTRSLVTLAHEVVSDLGMQPSSMPGVVEKAFYVSVIQDMRPAATPIVNIDRTTDKLLSEGFTMKPVGASKSRTLCKGEVIVEIRLPRTSTSQDIPQVVVTWGNGAISCAS